MSELLNIEAEQALIGAAVYEREALVLADAVRPEHFGDPVHAIIWAAAQDAVRAGGFADPAILHTALSDNPGYRELGGVGYLAELMDHAPPVRAVPAYCDAVLNAARLRAIVDLAERIREDARPGANAYDLIAASERELTSMLQDAAPVTSNLVDAQTSAFAAVDEIDDESVNGRAKGAMTGLRCFDRRLGGFRPGHLVVLAGRPSMGKTALARAGALGCARKNPLQTVLMFALEMERRELSERTLAHISFERGDGVAYTSMSKGKLAPEDRAILRDAAQHVPDNLLIDDSPVLSVDYVRRRVLAMRRKRPIALVVIDYLQIMQRPDVKGRTDAAIIGDMTSALKRLAREAECCVLLLSQVSRQVEGRDDKRPQLSDLRDSGAIEQDANAVLFAYREFYYLERAKPAKAEKVEAWETACEELRTKMTVIAGKVRGGPTGYDEQRYLAPYDLIDDIKADAANAYEGARG